LLARNEIILEAEVSALGISNVEPIAERLLQTFLELVRIDSPSGDEAALRQYLVDRLNEADLQAGGVTHQTDAGGNLIVEVPGYQCVTDFRLVLSAHMDVVPPCLGVHPVVETIDGDQIIHSDSTTVLGADDKSGLAPILETVFYAVRNQWPRPAMRLLFTTREETGLDGAKELPDEALKADFAITLDHTGRQGVIIHQAPTYIAFEIECCGKSAHAGMQPEQGISAVVLAAWIIARLHLGRIDADTTANIGMIHGGEANNVIPSKVMLSGELRSHNCAQLQSEIDHINTTLQAAENAFPGSVCRWTQKIEFEHYRIPPEHPGILAVNGSIPTDGVEPGIDSHQRRQR
jgi:tripeptide aminopeptidase